jgi:hypothetical protein
MTGSMRPGRSLALAAGLVVLVACGDSKKVATIGGNNPGTQYQSTDNTPPTDTTTPTDDTAPTDNTTPTPPGDDDGGTIVTPRHPESWAPPTSATESVEQLTHFWVEERFDWNGDHAPVQLDQDLDVDLLAKAEADECYGAPGTKPVDGVCSAGIPKRNQAYVWGLTRTGRDLWFGTMANVVCQVALNWVVNDPNASIKNDYFVCEGGQNDKLDFRPPHMYRFNLDERKLYLIDPDPATTPGKLLLGTLGLRSTGEPDGVVFLAGPSALGAGVNMFAFDADTTSANFGKLIAAASLPDYNNVRNWVKAKGGLYVGMGNVLPETPDDATATAVSAACEATPTPCPALPGGSILRWVGNKGDPLHFQIVGVTDNDAANLAVHDGRIFVATWPSFAEIEKARPAGLWMSPIIPDCGLTIADAGDWKEIWSVAEYDRDPIALVTTAGGAIASYNGKLYFGTMAVPLLGTTIAQELYAAKKLDLDANGNGQLDADELLATALGTHRSVALFVVEGSAADAPAPDPTNCRGPYWVETLFGEKYLPRYDADRKMYTIVADDAHETPSGMAPLKGSSGFGNFFNAYVWSMAVYRDQLYIGTFDWSLVLRATLQGFLAEPQPAPTVVTATDVTPTDVTPITDGVVSDEAKEKIKGVLDYLAGQLGDRIPQEGADLIRVTCDGSFEGESFTGVGNYLNYGVRNMITDDDALYVGTANPMNLQEKGGWELLRLTPRRQCGEPDPEPVPQ